MFDANRAVKLSIIVVTFRDAEGLARTLRSVGHLVSSASDVECLVVDGGTDQDELEAAVHDYPWAEVVSERDGGIYDAMNKGLRRSRGDFVWFLNGGDESLVADGDEFISALSRNGGSIVMFDYELNFGQSSERRPARTRHYLWHGLPTSHQAILYPGDAARAAEYDLEYKIVGDYAFTSTLHASGIPIKREAGAVARFYVGGTSQLAGKRLAIEASRVQKEILHTSGPIRLVSRYLHAIARARRASLSRNAR